MHGILSFLMWLGYLELYPLECPLKFGNPSLEGLEYKFRCPNINYDFIVNQKI